MSTTEETAAEAKAPAVDPALVEHLRNSITALPAEIKEMRNWSSIRQGSTVIGYLLVGQRKLKVSVSKDGVENRMDVTDVKSADKAVAELAKVAQQKADAKAAREAKKSAPAENG